jgi:hypothetical protein
MSSSARSGGSKSSKPSGRWMGGRLSGSQGIRCPNCDKLLAERLVGTLVIVCIRCKKRLTITR